MAVILLLKTNDEPTVEYLFTGKCTVGRSSQCDLSIDDTQMSGLHGMFIQDHKGRLFYSDSGSTNGSYLNNAEISKTQLKINDSLRVGNTIIAIDAKKLTPAESSAIGYSTVEQLRTELDLPAPTKTRALESHASSSANNSNNDKTASIKPLPSAPLESKTKTQKSSVVLNKDLKKKAIVSDWAGGKKDRIIEQEESSGDTKFLKLDLKKKKKN